MDNNGGTIIAFLTGQSDPRSCALCGVQRDFIRRSSAACEELFPLNFPYSVSDGSLGKVPLWQASWNNARHYWRSRDDAFAESHRLRVLSVFGGYGRVIVLAGSCGLELLVNLRLPDEVMRRVHVFAYGPVSRSLPRCASMLLVQGTADPISKIWHRKPDRRVKCHHMNYLESTETLSAFDDFYHSITREPHVPD